MSIVAQEDRSQIPETVGVLKLNLGELQIEQGEYGTTHRELLLFGSVLRGSL